MLKKIITSLLLVNLMHSAYTQTDTITYAECEIDTTETQYDKLLKYFIIEKEEVKHLWKFNAVDWGMINPSIAFEQRLSKRSSVEIENKFTFTNLKLHDQYNKVFGGTNIRGELNAEYRFYYNKKHRERKGKNTNGFSANYLFTGGGVNARNDDFYHSSRGYLYDPDKAWVFNYNIKAGIGIQRRMGSIGYADIKFGFFASQDFGAYGRSRYSKEDSYFTYEPHAMYFRGSFIDINLGIALKSLKRPLFK